MLHVTFAGTQWIPHNRSLTTDLFQSFRACTVLPLPGLCNLIFAIYANDPIEACNALEQMEVLKVTIELNIYMNIKFYITAR